ncbi:hypothetical protein FRB90_011718 [Tulasnella sp. 427]|nr:hypothetical protein FRB90_011718 [Tulasnella sp. 427]
MSGRTLDDDVPAALNAVDLKKVPEVDEKKDWSNAEYESQSGHVITEDGVHPTEDELHGPNKLRRISDAIPWPAYLIALIELAERFSYYGTTAVFTNFIQRPLPPGSRTGAGGHDHTSGALGLGTNASTGLTTFNSFWVYVIPLFGAYIADTRLGRFKTVCWSVLIALIGHIIMIISSVPTVIIHPKQALACFVIALIIMGVGTGGFKANVSPLVAEQYKVEHPRIKLLASGERVIVDPAQTTARIYLYFYLMINVGSLLGQIGMTYSEKYVGFWLAYTLPTIMFMLCPIVLWLGKSRYTTSPPKGSVVADTLRVFRLAAKGHWSLNFAKFSRSIDWDRARPANIIRENQGERPAWCNWDDQFVDETRRALKACQVFLFYPLYWLSYNQLNNNLISQAATMQTNGVPNDIIQNLDPLALIIFIPICDYFVYPALRRAGYNFSPLKRIFTGFLMAALSMVWAAVVQYYIYQRSPCGYYANGPTCDPAPLNVWIQSGSYILIGFSEIFASISGLEYAFQMAPKRMRSMVMAIFLFMSAISSAIGEAFNPLAADPHLIWNYASAAIISGVAGIVFWICFRKLDAQQDELNEIGKGKREDDEIVFWESEDPWVYGGEYESFAQNISRIVQSWRRIGLEPHFVFDGAEPVLKFPQHTSRIQDTRIAPSNIFFRTSTVRRNEPAFLRDNRIIPPLSYGACVDALLKLDVSCTWADAEADPRCVEIAASMGTWVLAKDTDFVILNAEDYLGYVPIDQLVWEYEQDAPVQAAAEEDDDGWTPAARGKGKGRKRSSTVSKGFVSQGLLPPKSGEVVAIKFLVYHPKTLANHLKIPSTFLPLFSSLVGNDFVPPSYRTRFFERRRSLAQQIERVGEVLHEVLSTGQDRRSRIGKLIAKNMASRGDASGSNTDANRPSVATLIQTAIQELLIRQGTAQQVDEMVETVIDAILQYGAECDPAGPFYACIPRSPHPYQELVRRHYTQAYEAGHFSPEVLEIAANGCMWANLFLENPDVESSGRTIATELVTWTAAVINDAFPIGSNSDGDESVMSKDAGTTTQSSVRGEGEEDDDELISVVEEQTDSEEEQTRARNRQLREGREETEDSRSDSNDPYYASYSSGVPVALLTSALKKLRRQQRDQPGSQAHSPATASVVTSGIVSPRTEEGAASFPFLQPQPTAITTHYRSSLRIVPQRLAIPTLSTLLDASSRGRTLSSTQSQIPLWKWQGPIQLQPAETRLKVFLHAMQGNTERIRGLVDAKGDGLGEDWVVIVLALRWAIIKAAERAKVVSENKNGRNTEDMKWKKRDAQAFILSCLRLHLELTKPADVSSNDLEPEPTLPEAQPRNIQLTSQILISIEATQHLAQVLLLSDKITVVGVERRFSGRRFHEALTSIGKLKSKDVVDQELFVILWRAVEEDSKAEWWGSDAPTVKDDKTTTKRASKSTPYSSVKSTFAKSNTSLYSALANLGNDW